MEKRHGCDAFQAQEIANHLFLGSVVSVNEDNVLELGLTSILNVTKEKDTFIEVEGREIEYLKIPVVDSSTEDLLPHFDICADFIHNVAQKGGKVLVHCIMGISRSATVCIAYLIKYQGMTAREAFWHVKSRRAVIHPNIGFWAQLLKYEEELLGCTSVELRPYSCGFIPDVYVEEPGMRFWLLRSNDLTGMLLVLLGLLIWDASSIITGLWYSHD